MQRAFRLGLAVAVVVGWTSMASAGWEEGEAAFDRGQYAEAITHFRPLADQGDAGAQVAMALMYRHGLGVPVDAGAALAWLRKAEAQGHARSIFLIGEMKHQGEGGPADVAGAQALYRRAAELGYPRAQAVLGALYADGEGMPRDDALAVQWYEKAASQGDGMALTNLGRMYRVGRQVPKDPKRAFALFEEAAQKGNTSAQAYLGAAYMDGEGVREDAAAGVKWLRAATDGGSAYGRFRLAWAHLEGQGVSRDQAEAARLFRASAEEGFVAGMREYARRLQLGEGVKEDLALARSWYERAAEQEDELAMYYLGVLHDEGMGVPADKAHAVYWYLRAARQGEPNAQNNLGVMYADGEYVARNPTLAYALFTRANAAGQERARKNLEQTGGQLSKADREKAQALSQRLGTPEGVDELLSASLAAAQGRPERPVDFDAVCLPAPPNPGTAQFTAWSHDVHDRGFLWRITKDGRASYLYGTMHVVKMPWAVPGPRLQEAFDGVDLVAVEAEVSQVKELRAPQATAAGGQPDPAMQALLATVLGPACTAIFNKEGVSPLMLASLVGMREAARLDMHVAVAPDVVLPEMARQRKIPVQPLEDPRRVLEVLESAMQGDGAAYLQAELGRSPQERRKRLLDLVNLWERGDFDRLASFLTWCECADTPEEKRMLQRMNDDRNEGMAQGIDALHAKGRRVLAAVGALHMTGDQSLLKLLAQRGYKVERVPAKLPVGATPHELRVMGAGTQRP